MKVHALQTDDDHNINEIGEIVLPQDLELSIGHNLP